MKGWRVSETTLQSLRNWIFGGETGFRLLECTLDPATVPGYGEVEQRLRNAMSDAVITNAGFYVGIEGSEDHTDWHVDAESWFFGSSFGNVFIPLIQDPALGSAMEFCESSLWDPSWTLLRAEKTQDDLVHITAATHKGQVVEVQAKPVHLETDIGWAYLYHTVRPHRSVPRGRRIGVFFGYVTLSSLPNPGCRPCDRRGFVDSIIACWQGKDEEDTKIVTQRYREFWRAKDRISPDGSTNPWKSAWLELRQYYIGLEV